MDQCAPVHLGTQEHCVRLHVPSAVQLVITLITATVQVNYRMLRSSYTVYLSWLPFILRSIPSACQCQNGGTCSGNTCTCPPGYSGTLCSTCIRPCSTDKSLNTSTCSCGKCYWVYSCAPALDLPPGCMGTCLIRCLTALLLPYKYCEKMFTFAHLNDHMMAL